MKLYKCKRCNGEFRRDDLQEHHIIPKKVCDDSNCDGARSLLCEECHKKTTAEFVLDRKIWLPNEKYLKVIDDA